MTMCHMAYTPAAVAQTNFQFDVIQTFNMWKQ